MSFARLSQRLSVKHICLSNVFHKKANKTMVFTEERTRIAQQHPEAARNSQQQPGATGCSWEAARHSHEQPGTARSSLEQPRIAGSSEEQPRGSKEAARSGQTQLAATRGSQEAARSSRKQPEGGPKSMIFMGFL